MSSMRNGSNTTAKTQSLKAGGETYAYRRFGSGPGLPLLAQSKNLIAVKANDVVAMLESRRHRTIFHAW